MNSDVSKWLSIFKTIQKNAVLFGKKFASKLRKMNDEELVTDAIDPMAAFASAFSVGSVFFLIRNIYRNMKNAKDFDRANAALAFSYGYKKGFFPELKGNSELDRITSRLLEIDKINVPEISLNDPGYEARLIKEQRALANSLEKILHGLYKNSEAIYLLKESAAHKAGGYDKLTEDSAFRLLRDSSKKDISAWLQRIKAIRRLSENFGKQLEQKYGHADSDDLFRDGDLNPILASVISAGMLFFLIRSLYRDYKTEKYWQRLYAATAIAFAYKKGMLPELNGNAELDRIAPRLVWLYNNQSDEMWDTNPAEAKKLSGEQEKLSIELEKILAKLLKKSKAMYELQWKALEKGGGEDNLLKDSRYTESPRFKKSIVRRGVPDISAKKSLDLPEVDTIKSTVRKVYDPQADKEYKKSWSWAAGNAHGNVEAIRKSYGWTYISKTQKKALGYMAIVALLAYGARALYLKFKAYRKRNDFQKRVADVYTFCYGYQNNSFPALKGKGNLDSLTGTFIRIASIPEGERTRMDEERLESLAQGIETELSRIGTASQSLMIRAENQLQNMAEA